MSYGPGRLRALGGMTIAALVGVVSLVGAGAAGADVTTNRVSGNAFGLRANGTVLGLGVNINNVPKASLNMTSRTDSNQSASDSDSLATLSVGTLETVGLLQVATTGTVGPGGGAHSTADVATLSGLINADAVHAECTADANGFSGSSSIVNLGFPLLVPGLVFPGAPTGTVTTPVTLGPVLGVTITLNEVADNSTSRQQTDTRSLFTGHVNAVHIASNGLLGNFDVVIGHAHCDTANRITPTTSG
jgi:hypothetical protein